MARKKKTTVVTEVEAQASPPVEPATEEAFPVSEEPTTRIEEIEQAIASDVQYWLATTNRNGTDKHYDKDGIYPEDAYILKQNEEDLANGYPNRFFRKM